MNVCLSAVSKSTSPANLSITFAPQILPAIQAAGRRVTLDLRGAESRPDILRAAVAAGVALDIAARSSTGAQGHAFYTDVAAQGAPSDVEPVRVRLAQLAASETAGFELDLAGPNIENYERLYWGMGTASVRLSQPRIGPRKGRSSDQE
ncbi:MAG: hypothetical protein WDO18_16060 [Acidobacteriota bacterium]